MFSSVCGSSKIVRQPIDEQSIPVGRARRVVSEASIFRIDIVKQVDMSSFCSIMMPKFNLKDTVF